MKKRVAVLEDDQDYREVLTNLLEKNGYEVIGASSGFEILSGVLEQKPDLILLDIMLPSVKGPDVINLFKEKEVIEDVPVVVISSKDISEIKQVAEEIGAVAWLQKPVREDELVKVINQYL